MSHAQGKPAISPGTVLFLWAFMAILSCGIAIQSILTSKDETILALLGWDRMPQFIETVFTPTTNVDQQPRSEAGRESSARPVSQESEIDEQPDPDPSLDFVTGSLSQEPLGAWEVDGQVRNGESLGGITSRYIPFPVDQGAGNAGREVVSGSVRRTEFAVVIARSSDRASLSRIWTMLREEQGDRFDDLVPRIIVESNSRTGMQLALLAGPLRNAQMAVELCAQMALPSSACWPIQYSGDLLPELTSGLQTE